MQTSGVKMSYTLSDGVTKTSKSLNDMLSTAITVDSAKAFAVGYSKIVAGTLTAVKHVLTTDVELAD